MSNRRMPGVRLECGASRFRVRRRIQEYLDRRGIDQASVADRAGVNRSLVTSTISGTKHSPKVLSALRELGVPEKYLFDPAKVQSEEAA